ncbi:MAG TPA: hypothetical protein VK048_01015 [Atopostipes sp.]|nr:hypothetical protein [Atopostipes sp.]
MTVEYWVNAERFYELWFVVISAFIILCGIVMIFIGSYARKKNRKKFLFIPGVIIVVLSIIGLLGHYRYQPYLEQASAVNPLIRDRTPRLATYVYYGSLEENYYKDLNALDTLQNMVLYEEEQVIEPVTYLGEGEYFHYFENTEGELFKQDREIVFTEESPHAQVVGSRFNLKDEAFQDIGFKNPKNTMFDSIKIPASEQGKIYIPEDDFQIPQTKDKFRRWNF